MLFVIKPFLFIDVYFFEALHKQVIYNKSNK